MSSRFLEVEFPDVIFLAGIGGAPLRHEDGANSHLQHGKHAAPRQATRQFFTFFLPLLPARQRSGTCAQHHPRTMRLDPHFDVPPNRAACCGEVVVKVLARN